MDRRSFLVGGGALLAAARWRVESALAEACATLKPGESADFAAGAQSEFNEADLAWQTGCHFDDANGRIHLLGKPANMDQAWHHQIYRVSTSQWTLVARGMWSNPGHIYGNSTMDPGTGDLYCSRGGMNGDGAHAKRIAWYQAAKGKWEEAPVGRDFYRGALVSHANGCAFHPNLYGPGDGGIVLDTQFRTLLWRKSTDAVQDLQHSESQYGGLTSCALYWPARDAVIFGGAQERKVSSLGKITPGATPTLTPLGPPPIATFGASHEGSKNFGSLHVHPGSPEKLIIVERVGSRVFMSGDATTWTEAGTHPFTPDPYVVCALQGLGTMWAIGCRGNRQLSRLWKPTKPSKGP
jgi:hypothetical protein